MTTSAAPSSADRNSRRTRMLAALDIDVWQRRRASPKSAEAALAKSEAPMVSVSPATGATGATGATAASAALALLEEAQDRAAASRSRQPVRTQGAADIPDGSDSRSNTVYDEPPLSLFCLSGPQGVLLAELTGLSPQGQRLLNDVFQAAMRIVESERSGKKLRVQKLHFNWPPAEGARELASDAPTGRALRGFLSRQLKDKPEPIILYAAAGIGEALASAQPEVAAERIIYIGEPEALLTDGAAKRALWQTLNRL